MIDRVITYHLPDEIRGAAESREIAFARLAPHLTRLSRVIMNAWQFEGDDERQREAWASLSFVAEKIAAAVLAIIEIGNPDVSRILLVRTPETLEALLERVPRGSPAWQDQPDTTRALAVWTMDLAHDVNDGIHKFDARGWGVEVDAELLRAVRDCVELSAALTDLTVCP